MLSENQLARRYTYPFIGLYRLKEPGVRWFVIIPLLINTLVFIGFGWWAFHEFNDWIHHLLASLPQWLGFLTWILWPLFTVLILLSMSFTFTIIASIIASPFNAFLAEHIQKEYGFQSNTNWKALPGIIPKTLLREGKKLLYYLPRIVVLAVLSFIPVINIIAPVLWFLFSAWMVTVQYADYPADNRGVSFNAMIRQLKQNRIKSLLFGAGVLVMAMIPVLNFFAMPSAVIGVTCFWEESTCDNGN